MNKPPAETDPADRPYEIEAFAEKHGLTLKAADVILLANGPSRVACDAAAKAFLAAVAGRTHSLKAH
ncbi:hypothetical protein MesoLj131c_47060 [Mesorhizobium sp. 131-3-5]|uniref:hypothetical protein n=1 Tax=Mesorhizobium sp. 131-3-5 TaxID=2744520 RepID=UPI0019287D31|nr:hypothetical protein [Mesorhizobium sp. 131-3-5]BCH10448.1 hypothetical protein MesoLj131c_47060 [Mesorhizobium sp. 131-3-5]